MGQGTLSIPAQINGLEEQISLKVSPQVPEPGKPVVLTVNAYGTDISKAKITWKTDGKVVLGPGVATSLTLTMGTIGDAVTVEVIVEPFNGPAVNKKVTLIPGEVDLIWEAEGYNPPFYKGKIFYGPEKNVKVVAIPNIYDTSGKKVNPLNLDFKWSKNNEIEGSVSGAGKNYWPFKGWILLKSIEVGVTVGSEGKVRGQSSFNLPSFFPEVRMYENSGIYGILFNRSLLGTSELKDTEQTVEVYPFSFGIQNRTDPAFRVTWQMNRKNIFSTEGKSKITVRNTENESGEAELGVKAQNINYTFDESAGRFTLKFSKKDFEF